MFAVQLHLPLRILVLAAQMLSFPVGRSSTDTGGEGQRTQPREGEPKAYGSLPFQASNAMGGPITTTTTMHRWSCHPTTDACFADHDHVYRVCHGHGELVRLACN